MTKIENENPEKYFYPIPNDVAENEKKYMDNSVNI